jgi:hypothetical protein
MSPEYQRTSEGKKMKTNAIVRKLMAPPLMSFVLFFFFGPGSARGQPWAERGEQGIGCEIQIFI